MLSESPGFGRKRQFSLDKSNNIDYYLYIKMFDIK